MQGKWIARWWPLVLGVTALIGFGIAAAPSSSADEVETAAKEMQSGQSYLALERLKELVASNPDLPEPHFYLATIYSGMRQHDLAMGHVRRALELDSSNNAYANLQGAIYIELREFYKALDAFKDALASVEVKDPAKVWRNIGYVHQELRDWDAAAMAFEKARNLDPRDAHTAAALGKLQLERHKIDEAVEHLTAAAELQPKAASVRAQLGIALGRAGRLDGAIDALRLAIEFDPLDSLARYNLAQSLLRQGKVEDGRRQMEAYDQLRRKKEEIEHHRLKLMTDFQSAVQQLELGKSEEAEQVLRRIVDQESGFVPAHYTLGYLLLRRSANEEGIRFLEEVLRRDPLNAGAYFYLAGAHESLGNLEAALEPARRATVIFDQNAEYHRQLGQIHLGLGHDIQARASLDQALKLDPNSFGTLLALGTLERNQGRFEQAISRFEAALATGESPIEALLTLAQTNFEAGLFDDGIARLRSAADLGTKEIRPHVALAEGLAKIHRFDEAEQALDRAAGMFPESSEIFSAIGGFHQSQGRLNEATEALEKALNLSRDSMAIGVRLQLAELYANQSRFEEAVAAYRQVLEDAPDCADCRGALANLLLGRHRLDAAEVELRRLLEVHPDRIEARAGLAWVLLETDRFSEAAEQARKVLESQAEHLKARYTLAMALIRAGQPESGRLELDSYQQQMDEAQTREHRTRELVALNQEALAKLEGGDNEAAIDLFRQTVERFPDLPQPRLHLGLALIKQNETREAIAQLEKAIEMGFDYPEVHSHLAEQYEVLGNAAESQRQKEIYLRMRREQRFPSKENKQ